MKTIYAPEQDRLWYMAKNLERFAERFDARDPELAADLKACAKAITKSMMDALNRMKNEKAS